MPVASLPSTDGRRLCLHFIPGLLLLPRRSRSYFWLMTSTKAELLRQVFDTTGRSVDVHLIASAEKIITFLHGQHEFAGRVLPDLILLDYRLPGNNGHVLSMLKGDPDLRSIPVIALCRSDALEDIKAVYDQHVNCCIVKPLRQEDLTEAVTAALCFWIDVALTVRPARTTRHETE